MLTKHSDGPPEKQRSCKLVPKKSKEQNRLLVLLVIVNCNAEVELAIFRPKWLDSDDADDSAFVCHRNYYSCALTAAAVATAVNSRPSLITPERIIIGHSHWWKG